MGTYDGVRNTRIASLVELAKQRQELLLLLVQKNPQLALARMMPRTLRDRLPAQLATYVEQEIAVQGTVRAQIAEDFDKGVAHTTYTLVPVGGGAALELHVADPTASERDLLKWLNRQVGMTAYRIDGRLLLADKKRVQLLAEGSTTTATATHSATAATGEVSVKGSQNTLVIMANFSDTAIACTPADLQTRLFGASGATMNQGYVESSGGLVSFSGKVIGPFNIPTRAAEPATTTAGPPHLAVLHGRQDSTPLRTRACPT
jgi:hypothetical protein